MFLQMRGGSFKDDKILGELFFKMFLDRNHERKTSVPLSSHSLAPDGVRVGGSGELATMRCYQV